jgi:Holliday junction resolvasome RuvABC endonuclease subunit
MNLMTLDPAIKRTGWAVITPSMTAPRFGALDLPDAGDEHAKFLAPARDFLQTTIAQYLITDLCYEAPFLGKNVQTLITISAFNGMVELLCHDMGVACTSVSIKTWRSKTHGHFAAPKHIETYGKRREWLKDQAIAFCRHRGWETTDPDAAEALCIMAFKLGRHSEEDNFKNLPLGSS